MIKKLELVQYASYGYLKDEIVSDTEFYKNVGRQEREELLEQLLFKGEDSIIRSGRTGDFIDALWKGMKRRYRIKEGIFRPRARKRNAKLLKVIKAIMRGLDDDPDRQLKILTAAVLEMEKIGKKTRV